MVDTIGEDNAAEFEAAAAAAASAKPVCLCSSPSPAKIQKYDRIAASERSASTDATREALGGFHTPTLRTLENFSLSSSCARVAEARITAVAVGQVGDERILQEPLRATTRCRPAASHLSRRKVSSHSNSSLLSLAPPRP